jgi:Dolichyl-phosphate-mannose-protein mannosyltransferase
MSLAPPQEAEQPATAPAAISIGVSSGWLFTLVVVGLAVWWRIPSGLEWPMTFHRTLQFESALTTRNIWLRLRPQPLDARETAWLTNTSPSITAPPIMQTLTATVYLLAGREWPAASAVIASLFWLAGAWFVYDLARQVAPGRFGAAVSLTFYLLAPYGIIVSQSFQPEALLVCALVAALWCLMRFRDRLDTWRGSLICGLVLGLALFAKPGITLFPLAGAYLAVVLGAQGWRRALSSPRTYLVGFLAMLPSVVYALVFLRQHVGTKILPALLTTRDFWLGWVGNAHVVVGWWILVPALVGAVQMIRTSRLFLGIGLLAGYFLYGTVFTWHTMTHDYYQVPLIPIAAICLAPPAQWLVRPIPAQSTVLPVLCKVAVLGLFAFLSLQALPVLAARLPQRRETEELIGRQVGDQAYLIALTEEHGLALRYHAWAPVVIWPVGRDAELQRLQEEKPLAAAARLDQYRNYYRPTHFVVTQRDELGRQPDLQALLALPRVL